MRKIVVLIAAFLTLAACGGEKRALPDLPVGTHEHTISAGNDARTFVTYRPKELDGPAPLVVVLHGAAEEARASTAGMGWNAKADEEGFVVAYPDGLDGMWRAAKECCGQWIRTADDGAFIEAVVDRVRKRVDIDARRIYVAGMSNGGMMAYALACQSDTFAAIAVVAGTQIGECPAPHPTSVLHIHGAADKFVRLDGAPGIVPLGSLPVEKIVGEWRRIARCEAPKQQATGEVTTWTAACAKGRGVELVVIANGGHDWPTGSAFSATDEVWDFFTAHPAPR